MTHGVHTHNDAQLKRRGFRLAMVFASTALISGSVILPATAATTAVSQSTVASVVTDGGKGGDERWGSRSGTGEGLSGNGGGDTGEGGCTGVVGPWDHPADTGGTGGTGGAASNGGKPTSAVERFRS
ncbi:hypothetical protein StrepF001_22915 [Streptomyces sp. F001]|uniref:hypothetical protein n=1 Tax=Streptomyces sp. F001 TaxID=1510026 RepID=UPI00101E8042|nr:hypothetical protein [Streptomyces sp. F001]RZB17523.1 hypothetical protein StrepF001_22915 [Streptomyces sp. F001]